jgi:hypothetical protein
MIIKPTFDNYYVIHLQVGNDFVLIYASEQLRNDIVDKCSDDVLFDITELHDKLGQWKHIFKVGKSFKHKGKQCFMYPVKPVEYIKDIFGIV